MTQLSTVQKLPTLPATQNIGTPELLLRRRPDIRVAERELASATAQIGVAVGDLFPRISFVGTLGLRRRRQRRSRQRFEREPTRSGPSIQWAAFDLGRVRQRIKQREAATDRALGSL